MSKFYPTRGKVAIRRCVVEEKTDGSVIYTPKEHPLFLKGQVRSIGHPVPLPNGKEVEPSFEEGDWVLYNRQGMEHALGFDMVTYENVIMVVEEDSEIS